MKSILIYALGLIGCLSFSVLGSEKNDNKVKIKEVSPSSKKGIIEYKALVYIDEPSLQRYGGKEKFAKDVKVMFDQTTRFWNNSKNNFDYYFRFVPAGLKVYPHIEGQDYEEAAKEARADLEEKYDYVLFLCLAAHKNTMACGGSSDGHAVIWCTKTLETQEKDGDIFHDGDYPNKLGTYSNLGHEAGHFRGATDLYQYPIKAKNNPVNGMEYKAEPCNMGTGTWVWSNYASAVFNFTAKHKRLPAEFGKQRFPDTIEITVKNKEGKVVPNATVTFYGCRAGGGNKGRPDGDNGPDVYEKPYRTYTTDQSGKIKIDDPYYLYQVRRDGSEKNLPKELPWGYWFNFLVEAKNEAGEKAYIWLPDLEVQRQCLEENVKAFKTEIVYP